MERYCGIVKRSVTSRLHPYGTLNQLMKRDAQLVQIINKFDLAEDYKAFSKYRVTVPQSSVLSKFECWAPGRKASSAVQ